MSIADAEELAAVDQPDLQEEGVWTVAELNAEIAAVLSAAADRFP